MPLYFAYGSNMDVAGMRRRCRSARALGTARLENWRFVIGPDGYASIMPRRGAVVHGVLWGIAARDRVALDLYEEVGRGAYRPLRVAVRNGAGSVPALTYVGSGRAGSRAAPGYRDGIAAAARFWNLPDAYVAEISRDRPHAAPSKRRAAAGAARRPG